jgi:hypothetical protein
MCGPRFPACGSETGLFALNVCIELTSSLLFVLNVLFDVRKVCVSFVKGACRLRCSIFSWKGGRGSKLKLDSGCSLLSYIREYRNIRKVYQFRNGNCCYLNVQDFSDVYTFIRTLRFLKLRTVSEISNQGIQICPLASDVAYVVLTFRWNITFPEHGGNIFLRNVGTCQPYAVSNRTGSYPTSQYSYPSSIPGQIMLDLWWRQWH